MSRKAKCEAAVAAFEESNGTEALTRAGMTAITTALVKAKVLTPDQLRHAMIEQLKIEQAKIDKAGALPMDDA